MAEEMNPHRFQDDLHKADSSVLKAAGVSKLWLHGNLALVHVDRKGSFVAADAKKLVDRVAVGDLEHARTAAATAWSELQRFRRSSLRSRSRSHATGRHRSQKLRQHLGKPELRGVLLLGTFQKICSKVDTNERARSQLVNNGISVYRLHTVA